jgi:hypothetical protein
MPKYRIYYAEREVEDGDRGGEIWPLVHYQGRHDYVAQTEWEERVEAETPVAALDAFFSDRVPDRSEMRWVDDYHVTHDVTGLDLNPELTYLWMEEGKLMEYQGMDEMASNGRVLCPLGNGEGDVDDEQAAEYESLFEDETAIGADIQG